MSGVPGGDGSAILLLMLARVAEDLAGNFLPTNFGITVREIPDESRPKILSVHAHLGNGDATVEFSEFVQSSSVSIDKALVAFIDALQVDDVQQKVIGFEPDASLISTEDGINIVFRLSQEQRAKAVSLSGTLGGDGQSMFMNISAGAFFDISGNPNIAAVALSVDETRDTTRPTLLSARLFYGNGTLDLTCNEFMDFTPAEKVQLHRIFIFDEVSGVEFNLEGGTVVEKDALAGRLRSADGLIT